MFAPFARIHWRIQFIFDVAAFLGSVAFAMLSVAGVKFEMENRLTEFLVCSKDDNDYPGFLDSSQQTAVQEILPNRQDVFVYSLSNADEFLRGESPRLDELGPYSYRMYSKKSNVEFSKQYSAETSRGTLPTESSVKFREVRVRLGPRATIAARAARV